MDKFNTIVIGGGPAGYRSALELAKKNKSVLMIEFDGLGGTCLNEGCIPTKSLLFSSQQKDISHSDMLKKKNNDVKKLQNGLLYQIKNSNIKTLRGYANIIGKEDDGFVVMVDNENYVGDHLIIATGSKTYIPNIPGLEKAMKIGLAITSKEVLKNDVELKNKIAIIGGGVIGIELAFYFSNIGKEVTILESKRSILHGLVDSDIIDILEEKMKSLGINIISDISIEEVGDSIVYSANGNYYELECEQMVVATGRIPSFDKKGIDAINVISDKSIITNEKCETNIPGVYACGDVNGKLMLAHVAYKEAEVAVSNICGESMTINYNSMPSVVFSNPEIAFSGYTEEDCLKKGIEYSVSKCSMLFSSIYSIKYGNQKGFCKLIFNKSEQLIGAELVGNGSSELIFILSDYIEQGITRSEICKKVFPHPSIVEIIKEAALH